MQAVRDGWPLCAGEGWEDKVLLLARVNDLGWYDVVDVIPANIHSDL